MTNGTARSPAASGEEKFLEQMNRELAGWDDPAARLRHALARDDLQLYCQPILSLRPPGAFTMAEALVRLREEEALLKEGPRPRHRHVRLAAVALHVARLR